MNFLSPMFQKKLCTKKLIIIIFLLFNLSFLSVCKYKSLSQFKNVPKYQPVTEDVKIMKNT